MGIKHGDLIDTIISKISIDEFEPKTGKSKDVMVVGFNITEESAGEDLNTFINSSIHDIRDVEVSPNPNKDGYFMVFVEMDRNEDCFENVLEIVKDVENVSGKLKWKVRTHLTDEYHAIDSDELKRYLITDPEEYLTKEEWEEQVRAEDERLQAEESVNDSIMEFLKDTTLQSVTIDESVISLTGLQDEAKFEIQGFGPAQEVMSDIGISESAIGGNDVQLRQFNKMLGSSINAVKIDEYIVMFNADTKTVLVGKPC